MKSLRTLSCLLMAVLLLAFSMTACTKGDNSGGMTSTESPAIPESSTDRRETESRMPGTESSKGLLDELGDDLSSDLDQLGGE